MPEIFSLQQRKQHTYTHTHFCVRQTTILIMAILKAVAAAAKAHYASCCVMVFHVVGFSCFSLKIGEMEIFHKTHNRVR